jgi:allophanate hydrolase
MLEQQSLDIGALQELYRSGQATPLQVMHELVRRLKSATDGAIWIARYDDEQLLTAAQALAQRDAATLPLYGIPFAIKDNIDLAGLPTTAACPAFAYQPAASAAVVQRLIDAGALPIGKTNLDQFATGLVGTRSPYGACHNSFDPAYISGGSSSGSAVAVATGLVSFALGTDTAGSGRVPAAFNNLIGYKPSCGLLSTRGVVPACRSLDCISVFTLTAEDAARVAQVASGFDPLDPFSRAAPTPARALHAAPQQWRFGVPQPGQLQFFGNQEYRQAFALSVERLQQLGGIPVSIDFAPFLEAARLLYEGPWVAERYLVIAGLLQRDPGAVNPVVREIIAGGESPSAAAAFQAQYRLRELQRACAAQFDSIDVLVTPTAGTLFRLSDIEAEPVRRNSELGYYTNYVNLLDLAAVAVPAGFTPQELPFGITLVAPAGNDRGLLELAALLQRYAGASLGALGTPLPASEPLPWNTAPTHIDVVVCGAHLQGLPLNPQLTSRGAVLRQSTSTAACYRMFALPGGPPWRPGLVRVAEGGVAIAVEVWSVPAAAFGSFVAGIPAPLGIGKVHLADGSQACGFICEDYAVAGAVDISRYGSWRDYLAALKNS